LLFSDRARFGKTDLADQAIVSVMITDIGSPWGRAAVQAVAPLYFCRHRRPLCRSDQGFDVFDAPHGAAAKFYGFGEATALDPIPPAGFFDRDESGNRRLRLWVADDLWQPEKSGLGKLVHFCSRPLVEWIGLHRIAVDYACPLVAYARKIG